MVRGRSFLLCLPRLLLLLLHSFSCTHLAETQVGDLPLRADLLPVAINACVAVSQPSCLHEVGVMGGLSGHRA